MNDALLEQRFKEIGASVEISHERPRTPWRNSAAPIFLDITTDKRGKEIFSLGIFDGAQAEVISSDPKDRHLLLLTRTEEGKSRFLCGHDERHWFVAAIPEFTPVTTVRAAKEALQPALIRESNKGLRRKKRLSRRNKAYKRQGEWFFKPLPDFEPEVNVANPVHRNEPLMRSGRASKPHMMELSYRQGGHTVFAAGDEVISVGEFEALSATDRKKKPWRARTVVGRLYAKGKISHPDHATLELECWHEVIMNEEQKARAMSHVVFID